MISIVGWIVCGFIAGKVAMWLLPPTHPLPGMHVIGFGIGGSIVGGFAHAMVSGQPYSPAGIVWSCIGAVAVVAAWRWYVDSPE